MCCQIFFLSKLLFFPYLGLVRRWNSGRNLTEMYYMDGFYKSMSWSIDSEYLIYRDLSLVLDDDLALLVPLNISQDIFVGNYYSILHVVSDIKLAKIKITSSGKDCVMQVAWDVEQEVEDRFLHLPSNEFISSSR